MLAALLAIGVHVEEVANTPLELAEALTSSLAAALKDRTQVSPSVDTLDWPACSADDRCLPEIRARLGAQEIVLLRYFSGPTLIRVVAHRMRPDENTPHPAIEVDIPKDRARWHGAFAALAAQLYESRTADRVIVEAAPPPERPPRFGAAPYIVLGASVAALAVGLVFGANSSSTADQIKTGFHNEGELDALESRLHTQAITADILFLVAGIAGLSGTALLIFD